MKILQKIPIILFSIFVAITAYGDQLNLATYYPIPIGIYDRIRLIPRSSMSVDCEIGTLYVDSNTQLQYCHDDGDGDDEGTWEELAAGVWTQTGDFLYPAETETNPNLFVGIGTVIPDYIFHVRNPSNPQIQMFYDSINRAFRAGEVTGTQWDTRGLYSTVLGYNSSASGKYAVALGKEAVAGEVETVAVGEGATVEDSLGVAVGSGAVAAGWDTVSLGFHCADTSAAIIPISIGSSAIAQGTYNLVVGANVKATGYHSKAFGTSIITSGDYSIGVGLDETERTITQDSVVSIMGGNVGIGTVSPDTLLDIGEDTGLHTLVINKGANEDADMIEFDVNGITFAEIEGDGNTPDCRIETTNGETDLILVTNNQDRITIKGPDPHYVGVGTTDPQTTLHIQSIDLNINSADVLDGGLLVEGETAVVEIFSKDDGKLGSFLSLAEFSSGGVFQNTWGVFRHANTTGDGNFRISYGTSPSWGGNPTYFMITQGGWFGIGNKGIDGWFNNPPTHALDMAGGAYCTGAEWLPVSSRKYKRDITSLPLDDALGVLEVLEPVSFRYKTGRREKALGFIAEDVPDLVASQNRKGLDPMDIVAVLTKVIKHNQEEIERLRNLIKNEY